MRKYQKAAVVVAMLGSVSFLGAGVGHAGEDGKFGLEFDSRQGQECSADEFNFTGSETGSVFAPTNTTGTQIIDQSERTSVRCAQIFGFGG
ncbi:hypothetical protein [Streptomyces sp. PSKA30]|uniref:hypothetical protein n=1 Tax=Streptomyces sp. PSKA30 TaxID=2874597 RepID=UPI001CD16D3E|nr:hypothetical protein [Streptomyces sp. PSKA30]MBZ9637961.1 hypothetical protein [Streptomyces sp. PSKA30]